MLALAFTLLLQLFIVLAGPISWVVIAAAAKRAADTYCGKNTNQVKPVKVSRFKAAFKAFVHPSGS